MLYLCLPEYYFILMLDKEVEFIRTPKILQFSQMKLFLSHFNVNYQAMASGNLIYFTQFNFIIFMTLDYRSLIKVGTIGVLTVYLISQAQELIRAIFDHKQVRKSKVKSINDLSQELESNKKSRLNVVKLKPYYFQQKEKEIAIQIHSAQRYKYEPSDKRILAQQRKRLSSKIDEKRNKYDIPITWYALVDPCKYSKGKHFCEIQGFGKISGDFFDVKRQYIPKKDLNYWQKFRNWIFERVYKSNNLIQQKRPFQIFLGPVVGMLYYDINLMKDINIIAVCNFEDGKIIPTVTATSKSEILNYYRNFIREKYITVGILLFSAIIIGRWLWSDIKKQINAAKVRRNKANFKYFNAEDVAEDKMCIICYNHVRNMIFFDCRHMIMCRECSENYDSDICPYCKMEIDDIKPVIEIP